MRRRIRGKEAKRKNNSLFLKTVRRFYRTRLVRSNVCPEDFAWESSIGPAAPQKHLHPDFTHTDPIHQANPRVNTELRQRLPARSAQPVRSSDGYRALNTNVEITSGGEGKMEPRPARHHFSESKSSGEEPDEDRGHPGPQQHVVNTEDSCHQQVNVGPTSSPDKDKNVSLLLKELDAVRNDNKTLLDQLVHKETELRRKEVEAELREEQEEVQGWERAAVVLEEVLTAQKSRDQALMSRLLLANEERDEAVLHARQLQQAAQLESVPTDIPDLDVEDLLQRVCNAESAKELYRSGSALLQHLQRARQRRHNIVTQEMKAVMEERDASIFKCKRLEQDLAVEQARNEEQPPPLPRKRSSPLQEEGVDMLDVHSSEELLAPVLTLPAERLSGTAESLSQPPGPSLLLQLELLSKQKQSLEAELQRCQGAEQEAKERARRLERLVDVLRRKVGSGSVRAVV